VRLMNRENRGSRPAATAAGRVCSSHGIAGAKALSSRRSDSELGHVTQRTLRCAAGVTWTWVGKVGAQSCGTPGGLATKTRQEAAKGGISADATVFSRRWRGMARASKAFTAGVAGVSAAGLPPVHMAPTLRARSCRLLRQGTRSLVRKPARRRGGLRERGCFRARGGVQRYLRSPAQPKAPRDMCRVVAARPWAPDAGESAAESA